MFVHARGHWDGWHNSQVERRSLSLPDKIFYFPELNDGVIAKRKKKKIASRPNEYIFYKFEFNSIKNKWSALSFTVSYELLLERK